MLGLAPSLRSGHLDRLGDPYGSLSFARFPELVEGPWLYPGSLSLSKGPGCTPVP